MAEMFSAKTPWQRKQRNVMRHFRETMKLIIFILTFISVSAFGQTGPMAERPGFAAVADGAVTTAVAVIRVNAAATLALGSTRAFEGAGGRRVCRLDAAPGEKL